MSYEKLDHPDVLAIIFHPRGESVLSQSDVVDYDFQVEENIVIGARLHLADKNLPNILFFHGNGEIASDYDTIGPLFNKYSMNLIAVDYRGYGRSSGTPTVSNMLDDSHKIFAETKEFLKESGHTGPIFIMGRSLGSSCAIELASSYQDEIAGLLVDSGFAQTLPLLLTLGVDIHSLGITESDGFGNVEKISKTNKPTLILHGQFDQIISLSSAENLQSYSPAKNKQFFVIPGADHNSIIEKIGEMYFSTIRQFMDKALKLKPKRWQRRKK